jgi:hypothetical protein
MAMRTRFVCLIFAALSMLLPIAAGSPPAFGQPEANFEVGLGYFASRLEPFGHWLNHPVWGQVWQPDAGRDFRPYFYGYWQYTDDEGWLWVSNEPYGDIVYHYGRWIYDPAQGWLWIPGYVWAPSWVVWRQGEDYVGWLPMPPAYNDLTFDQPPVASYAPEASYGYEYAYGSSFASDAFANLWIFALADDFGRSDRRHYVIDRDRQRDFFHRSKDHTRYDTDHDHVVDRSIDREWLEHLTHRALAGEPVRRFQHRNVPMETVSQGREIFRHDRDAERVRLNTAGDAAGAGAAGTVGNGAPRGPRNAQNNAVGAIDPVGREQRAGGGQPGGIRDSSPDLRRGRAFTGIGRNPLAGLGPLPPTPARPSGPETPPAGNALGALPPGQPLPGHLYALPGSRMHVVRGIGPSTDGIAPATPSMPAVGAGLQPGPARMGIVPSSNVPYLARMPVGVQPPALGLAHPPGPVLAPAPSVAPLQVPSAAPAPAPQAPASAPRASGFNHFGGRNSF